jgi:hypothetical protein
MYLRIGYEKKPGKNYFCWHFENHGRKGAGSGTVIQLYGSVDPDPHQKVTDPEVLAHNLLFIRKSLHKNPKI